MRADAGGDFLREQGSGGISQRSGETGPILPQGREKTREYTRLPLRLDAAVRFVGGMQMRHGQHRPERKSFKTLAQEGQFLFIKAEARHAGVALDRHGQRVFA